MSIPNNRQNTRSQNGQYVTKKNQNQDENANRTPRKSKNYYDDNTPHYMLHVDGKRRPTRNIHTPINPTIQNEWK